MPIGFSIAARSPIMPTLLDIQRVMHSALVDPEAGDAEALIVGDGLLPRERLAIYRNTIIGVLVNALRLSYPAVERLVGGEFFEGAARSFVAGRLPQSAYLNDYGREFPEFLNGFAPASSLPYLPDVAQLEWAVNRALHAPDQPSLNAAHLAGVDPADHGRIRFSPHPSLTWLRVAYPADTIWRAVLNGDDAALAAIDLSAGSVALVIEHLPGGVTVSRLDDGAWQFLSSLCEGATLQAALDAAAGIDPGIELAEHLSLGRLCGFTVNKGASDFSKEAA